MDINLTPRLTKGEIIEINDMGVKIEFKGKMGRLNVPLRMLISDEKIEKGDKVELYLSYINVTKQKGLEVRE